MKEQFAYRVSIMFCESSFGSLRKVFECVQFQDFQKFSVAFFYKSFFNDFHVVNKHVVDF